MREELERIWRAGVAAAMPARLLPPHLPEPPAGRTVALAIGKAAAAMAETLEAHWPWPLSGLAVAPHGASAVLRRIALVTAAHPVPDEASRFAAARLLALASAAGEDDLVLVLLSGGASALASLASLGLAPAEKRRMTEALLRSGAPIGEINCVRRHLSRIKGGRLGAAAAPTRLVTLALSDVAGDRAEDIGSGPTVADPTSIDDARAVLRRYGVEPPASGWSESEKRVDGSFGLIGGNRLAVDAAAAEAERLGYRPVLLGESSGEARLVGRTHAFLALESIRPTAVISGGELSVRVEGGGRGGPNSEYALAAAIALAGTERIAGLAADSDGLDGSSGAAGAFFDGSTVARSTQDPRAALAANDSGAFFADLDDLFAPGPTGTNVNDLRIILVDP